MKNKGAIIIALLVMVGLGYYFYKKYRIAPNQILAQLELCDVSNVVFDKKNFQGKAFVLTFYASWCGDCMKEMPGIQSAIDNELNHLMVYAITDEAMDKLNTFKNNHNYTFNYLKLVKAFKYYDIHAIPTTYIFDKRGQIIFSHVGFIDWKDPVWLQFIRSSTM